MVRISEANSLYICTMQKALKIAATLAVSVLYGMAVFHIYGMLLIQIDHSALIQKDRSEAVYVMDADASAGYALPGNTSFAAEVGGPSSVTYFQLHKFSAAIVKSAQQIFSSSYSSYVLEWLNFLIGLSTPDIIFPFHYFW
jgi:hypothetical protein